MTIATKLDQDVGFIIQIDGQTVFQVSSLPEGFLLELPTSERYFLSRTPQDFLSNVRYVLTDSERHEIASISGSFLGTSLGNRLTVGEEEHIIRLKTRSMVVEGLPIKTTISGKFFSCEIHSEIDAEDAELLPICGLIQFAHIFVWRQSSG